MDDYKELNEYKFYYYILKEYNKIKISFIKLLNNREVRLSNILDNDIMNNIIDVKSDLDNRFNEIESKLATINVENIEVSIIEEIASVVNELFNYHEYLKSKFDEI